VGVSSHYKTSNILTDLIADLFPIVTSFLTAEARLKDIDSAGVRATKRSDKVGGHQN
jgi:hypothetical protein